MYGSQNIVSSAALSSRDRFSPGASHRMTNGSAITGMPKIRFTMTSVVNVGSISSEAHAECHQAEHQPCEDRHPEIDPHPMGRPMGRAKFGSRSDIAATLLEAYINYLRLRAEAYTVGAVAIRRME